MKYLLVDSDDIIRNMITWTDLAYNPAPLVRKPWKDGAQIGLYYTDLAVVEFDVFGIRIARVAIPRL